MNDKLSLQKLLTVFMIMISPVLHGMEQTEVGISPFLDIRGSVIVVAGEVKEDKSVLEEEGVEVVEKSSGEVHITSSTSILSALYHLPMT